MDTTHRFRTHLFVRTRWMNPVVLDKTIYSADRVVCVDVMVWMI